MLIAVLALLVARADDGAYYHPDEVAARSRLFAEAARLAGPAFEEHADRLKALGRHMERLELGVAMLGTDAPEGLAEWTEQTRRTVTGQYLQVQRHVDLLQDDYVNQFTRALEDAKASVAGGVPLRECGASGVAAMMGRSNCAGRDLNDDLARAVDDDRDLERALAEINAVPWPEVGITSRTWPAVPVTGSESWVDLALLAEALATGAVERRRDDLDHAVEPLEERIAAGDEAAVGQAARQREAYVAGLASDGALLRQALGPALERAARQGGPAGVGLCANPAALGGCTGREVTQELLPLLRQDRKLAKALAPLGG